MKDIQVLDSREEGEFVTDHSPIRVEGKKIRIREAKARDVGLFRKLWKAYLESNEKCGSSVAVTDRNLILPGRVFESYVDAPTATLPALTGIVLFVADYAVLMAGESPAPLDYTCGKVAHLWGVYVQPGHEVGEQLVTEGLKRLKEKGFNTVLFTCTAEHGIQLPNAKPLFVTVKVPLE